MIDLEQKLADSIAREDTLRAYILESNQARQKLQREVEEQEQEIADLNREIAGLKNRRTMFYVPEGIKPGDGILVDRDRLVYPSANGSIWSWLGNFIKRLSK